MPEVHSPSFDRRRLLLASAWSTPAIVLSAAAPAYAASGVAAVEVQGERYMAYFEPASASALTWGWDNHVPPLSWEVAAAETDDAGASRAHPFSYDLRIVNVGDQPLRDVVVSVVHGERRTETSPALDSLAVALREGSVAWVGSRERVGVAVGDVSPSPTEVGWRHLFTRAGELAPGQVWDLEFVLRQDGTTTPHAELPLPTQAVVSARAGTATVTHDVALGLRYSD